ncbi:MAG: metallophosphoesterase [Candidatus Micrarchaeota archaeon]|nr:metallophosphoesterase [Candidatus Micrarchaeota archaeon]
MMKLTDDIELGDGLPLMYIRSLDSIVCSDLHLGYEGVMASRGSFVPKLNFRRIRETMAKAVKAFGAKNVIVVGDIKNEFADVHVEEFNEFREFIKLLRQELRIQRIILIKGNHDNFIDRFRQALDFEIHAQEAPLGDYLFFHGEELPKSKEGKTLVMGHLHPAIGVYNKVGVKEKIRCFLYGKLPDGRKIIILPAMNYFAEGVDVNQERVGGMAPIFERMLDIDGMRALCLGEGEILDFGKVGELRKLR